MDWWQAVILGIVEGLTEFLPVSSTGHIVLVQKLLGIGIENKDAKDTADAFAICIQSGAIVAVMVMYWSRVKDMGKGFLGKSPAGKQLGTQLLIAFMPAAVLGVSFNDAIKAQLFSTWPIIFALFAGGVAILAVSWRKRNGDDKAPCTQRKGLDQLTWQMALIIGLAQCVAMWPGTSRSLMTIVAGVLVGLELVAAVEFSFLLGLITLGAATVWDGKHHGANMLEHYGWSAILLGFVFAMLSAMLAIKWMVGYLNRHGLAIFGFYRVAFSLIVAVMALSGWFTVQAKP